MDIAALSTTLGQVKLQENASMLVLRKVMDIAQQQAAQSLTNVSLEPGVGTNIDILA